MVTTHTKLSVIAAGMFVVLLIASIALAMSVTVAAQADVTVGGAPSATVQVARRCSTVTTPSTPAITARWRGPCRQTGS